MPDPLNILGFVSWGLLGSAEGEGATVYVLDLAVEAEMGLMEVAVDITDPVVSAEMADLSAAVIVDDLEVAVELEDVEA